MYYITGSNIFGQWMSKENIIESFRELSEKDAFCKKNARLVYISWSYNIVQCDNEFYAIGAWNGLENQCHKVELPEECINSDVSVVGNDYQLVVVNKNTNTLWTINLEHENDVKKIRIDTEAPIEKESKKQKKEDIIVKVAAFHDSFLFLTTEGVVYSGLLPSYIDTSHCRGKVVDVQCGYEHYLLLTDVGEVYTWGNGRRLQLGHGETHILESPLILEALAGIKITKIAAGGWHSLALSEFGDLYAWGWNDTGQLGIMGRANEDSLKICAVPTLINLTKDGAVYTKNVKDIACGSRHSVILLEDDTIWTAGGNKYGQLGLPVNKDPVVQAFKESFHCKGVTNVLCGLWSTAIVIS